jgi:hypothetical protein
MVSGSSLCSATSSMCLPPKKSWGFCGRGPWRRRRPSCVLCDDFHDFFPSPTYFSHRCTLLGPCLVGYSVTVVVRTGPRHSGC